MWASDLHVKQQKKAKGWLKNKYVSFILVLYSGFSIITTYLKLLQNVFDEGTCFLNKLSLTVRTNKVLSVFQMQNYFIQYNDLCIFSVDIKTSLEISLEFEHL